MTKINTDLIQEDLDNLHSAISTEISDINTYSTTEINTGKNWIDGKKIYRKVITGALSGTYTESGNRYTWIPSNLSNINITQINFIASLNDRVLINIESSYITGIDYITSGANGNKIQIGSNISNVPINTPITVILEYTKNN